MGYLYGSSLGGLHGNNLLLMKPTGYLLINKPKDVTSFQVVDKIKKIINQKIKIGHAGTLDPIATGLLIVCVGRQATKSISKFMNLNKVYEVTAKLGELTDTLDLTGVILETKDNIPNKQEIEDAMKKIGSQYVQTPPIYSALKHKGKPLYKLAREKKLEQSELEKIIKEKSRTIDIYNLQLISFESPFFTFRADVSKGTYVRSLANDIAALADSIATTYEIKRVKIGPFALEKSVDLSSIKTIQDVQENLTTMGDLL